MNGKINQSNKGFTIIEVMIVLAVAGMIILIVLLAVPALQRNGRNTALKSDATAISGAVNEFKSNNDGQVPDSPGITGTAPTITISNSILTGAAPATAKVQSGTVISPSATAPATPLTNNTVYVVPKFKCNDTSNYTAATDIVASPRGVVVIYPVEQASGPPIGRCIDS